MYQSFFVYEGLSTRLSSIRYTKYMFKIGWGWYHKTRGYRYTHSPMWWPMAFTPPEGLYMCAGCGMLTANRARTAAANRQANKLLLVLTRYPPVELEGDTYFKLFKY